MNGDVIQIAIPACNELEWLPQTLGDLSKQSDQGFEVWICVNHAQNAMASKQGQSYCLQNGATLAVLEKLRKEVPFRLHVLDATGHRSPEPEQAGVGWARRTLFETIARKRNHAEIGVSLDADTRVDPFYVASIRKVFREFPRAVGCALPYYHQLPDCPAQALQLLRYEIYLRYYHVHLWRVGSLHGPTALGSALAFRLQAYLQVGGFPLRQAGEDFYLLQRLLKKGPIISWCESRVEPASRVSNRVPFGTGILLKPGGLDVLEQRFPFYDSSCFQLLGETYAALESWYSQPGDLAIQEFLDLKMGGRDPLLRMRQNVSSAKGFVKAFHGRFDGLKILQCLRFYQAQIKRVAQPQESIRRLLEHMGMRMEVPDFQPESLDELGRVRDKLWQAECQFRKQSLVSS